MITIPLQPEPSQSLNVTLGLQNVEILLYNTDRGLFANILSDGTAVANGVVCLDAVPLVRALYNGFVGNLCFVDTQGANDPQYAQLGTRYLLVYMNADEYVELFQ